MRFEKIKKLLRDKNINFKDKKVQAISGVVAGALIIAVAGTMILHNKSSENNNIAIEKNAEDIELDKNKELSEELVVENIEEHVHDENCNHDTESSTNELNETTTSSKVINENEENSTESSNNQGTTTDSNKTSSSNISSTSSNTSNQSTSKPSTSTSQHTHTWVEVYKDVYHKEEGHYETVTIKDAWTESIPVYEEQARDICNGCGKDITGDPWGHIEGQMLQGNVSCGGFTTDWKRVQVGTNTINHPAVTEQKWVVDKQAWTEKVLSGYKCNSCGATK